MADSRVASLNRSSRSRSSVAPNPARATETGDERMGSILLVSSEGAPSVKTID